MPYACVMSHFVIPDALCNNNLSHSVIKLLCCFLQYKIFQKSLRNWVVTLCNKIIISICLPTFLPSSIISLLPQDLWPPYLVGWGFKVKDRLEQGHLTLWSRGQVITWQMKKVIFPLPRGLRLLNVTGRKPLIKRYYPQSHTTSWSHGHVRSHDK